jgi:phenylpropionate dioxygenase-like ring-hydroxylating dioxygenase large terminal subunit
MAAGMNAAMDDRSVVKRILAHIENRTTDLGTEVWREPVENYRSPERYAAELALLRRYPVPFCPSAALAETGAYIAREAAGVPLLVVRNAGGGVSAFRNACRHRGMQVAEGSGCKKAFACRYHGWTYGLDGALKRVPHEEGFPGLDKAEHGLVPVRAEERNGIVFVTQDSAGRDLEDLPPLISADQRPFAEPEESVIDANWKIFLEGFIEGYHIRSTHPETFLPYGFDNLNLVDIFGRNSRVTYPFRRIRKLAELPEEERKVTGYLTYVYQLFPNVLVTKLSSHTKLVILEPLTIDTTKMIVYSLTNGDGPGAIEEAKRDAEFVSTTGAAEDREVVRAIQRGLASNANQVFTFGKFESAIAHFHRTLTAALG